MINFIDRFKKKKILVQYKNRLNLIGCSTENHILEYVKQAN